MRAKFLFILITSFGSSLVAQNDKVWTLKECVNHAIQNNISIKQAELNKEVAAQDVFTAKWNFAPNLNSSASQRYDFGSSISASGARASADFRSNNFGINSSLILFNGFANIHTLKQANIGVQAQEAALSKMKNDISLNIVNAYLQVLFAKEQIKVATSQVKISEGESKRIEELVKEGVLPKGDLLNAESTLANDNQALVVAKNTFDITSLQLAQILQLKEATIEIEELEVNINDQIVSKNDVKTIYSKAETTFPEIKLAELNIQSAEKSIKIAQSGYYPTLSLSYGLNTVYQHRQGFPDFFSFSDQLNNNLGNSFAVSLNIPIFNRFQSKSNVRKAEIDYVRNQYNLESEKLRLRENIQTAYADALSASKSYDAATVSVEAQNEAFNYAQERFQEGVINSFDFNQAKNNLYRAESELIRSKYDFLFKSKVLEFYYGIPFSSN